MRIDPRRSAHRLGIAAGHALQALRLPVAELSPDALLADAVESAGHDHWGEPHPGEALARLTEDLNRHARLHLPGRLAARYDLARMLAHRLEIEQAAVRDPGIARRPVARPVFIIGLPRTGTTILHQLLASDPAQSAPATWEVLYPVPGGGDARRDRQRRRARAAARLRWMPAMSPGFLAAHPLHPDDPQECVNITAHTLQSDQFQSMYRVPEYQRWWQDQPKLPVYAFHRRFLQYLQSRPGQAGPGEADPAPRRWILKAPAHLFAVDALLTAYPDALIVLTHRDPAEVMPSLASLAVLTRSAFSDRVDPHQVGREMFERWSGALDHALAARQRLTELGGRILDVRYDAFMADPPAMLERVYRHCGLDWSPWHEQRLGALLRARRQHRHGVHRYRLEDFGLSRAAIQDRLGRYREAYL